MIFIEKESIMTVVNVARLDQPGMLGRWSDGGCQQVGGGRGESWELGTHHSSDQTSDTTSPGLHSVTVLQQRGCIK